MESLLHQVWSNAPLHGQLALALKDEFSRYDCFSLGFGLSLHVCEAIIFAELLLLGCLVDQIASHLLKLLI